MTAAIALLGETGRTGLSEGVRRVSAISDIFGYDVWVPVSVDRSRHLEVKTCVSSSTYRVHLSRHEADVAAVDSDWRLVVCSADLDGQLDVAGVCGWETLLHLVPEDRSDHCQWESAAITLSSACLMPFESTLDEP